MVIKMESKTDKLLKVFNTMTYGENLEDTSQANEWLRTIKITDKSGDINSILKNVNSVNYIPQRCHLTRLAQELRNSVDIICQIEILSRGILSKDTRGAIDTLAQYIHYYACLCDGKRCDNVAVGIFHDDHPLWLLGLYVAPALAAGYKIILQTGTKFAAVTTFILQLATKVGIPEEMLILIPTNECELQPYLSNKDVSVISLFIDMLNEKYRGINKLHKKLLIFTGYKAPMLIFDNADLDSAADSAVYAAWGYQGMLPWSISTILVQENVYTKFIEKIKNKLESIKIGYGDDKLADISYPSNPNVFQRMTQIAEKARRQGIEVYQKATSSHTNFAPTLIMGFRVETNNVLNHSMEDNDRTVTVLPFRSIDEGINLANNNRQGLAASIWSENVGLVNEVARKLKVSNVWINGFGCMSPILPLCPFKDSGVGYFGGKQGKLEYNVDKSADSTPGLNLPSSFENVETINKAILSGKNALIGSSKKTVLDKMKQFIELSEFVESNEKKLCAKLDEHWLNDFKDDLNSVIFKSQEVGNSTSINGYSVISEINPRGILAIEMRNPYKSHNIKLLLAALFEGNAILLLNESLETQEFYQQLSKQLPAGILTLLPYNLNTLKTASNHKELNGYFSSHENIVFGSLPLKDSKIFSLVKNNFDWEQIFNHVRIIKNIWSNIGQSSQCNL